MHKDLEKRKLAKEIKNEQEREWEDNRDKRAKDWRTFQGYDKYGRKRKKIGLKAPRAKMEPRPKSAPKIDEGRPMGMNETYKRDWR